MLEQLQHLGVTAGLITAGLLGLRELTITVVVFWSMRANKAGREHALALLKILRAERRRSLLSLRGPDAGKPPGSEP